MKIFSAQHWFRFKQELPSIVLLSTLYVWWNFHFPVFVRLGSPWHAFWAVSISIISVILIVILFSAMDKFAPVFRLDHIEDTPLISAPTSKKMNRMIQILVTIAVMFWWWRSNIYSMSNIYYIIFFAMWILTYALMYRAAYRFSSKNCQ